MYQVAALWLPCCFQCWYEHFSFFLDYLITENPVNIDAAVYMYIASYTECSPLHIASRWTLTGNLLFLSASRQPLG